MTQNAAGNRKAENRNRKRKKKRRAMQLMELLMLVLAVFLLVLVVLSNHYLNTHFMKGTRINGIDASNMTIEQLESEMREYTLSVRERTLDGNYVTETITGDAIGVTVANLDELQRLLKGQSLFGALKYAVTKQEQSFEIDQLYEYIEPALQTAILKLQGFREGFYEPPTDACLSDYTPQTGYIIVHETQGNELNQTRTREAIAAAVDTLLPAVDLEAEGCYEQPRVYADDASLQALLPQLKKYTDVVITYRFGEQVETLDGSTISGWLTTEPETGLVTLDQEAVKDYVASLRKKYDSIFRSRSFQTSYGREITVEGGDYGWWMNYVQEQSELLAMLEKGESGQRTPVYYQTAAAYGSRDYGNTYVEINLTAQHLFLYVEGQKVLESDFVSGNAARAFDTPEGTYGLTYKEQDAVLVGENYETPVSYWMPFNENIGLHDAIWRDSFGNNIYQTGGSHGCINLPYNVAKKIYGYVAKGTPVICYNLPGTQSESVTEQSDQEKAQSVIDAIAKIGEVTRDSEKKIKRARQLYKEVGESVREYVTNLDVLEAAEASYKSLKK